MAELPFEIAHRSIKRIDVVPPCMERGVSSISIDVVRPGDQVRIVNALDAVGPAAKADAPQATFPGALGPIARAGVGRTDVLDGIAVISTCDYGLTHDLDSLPDRPDGTAIVDMAGPGAAYSPWSTTINVVLTFTADPAVALEEADRTVRRTTLAVARDLAAGSAVAPPNRLEQFPDTGHGADGLPTVVSIVHVGAEGPLLDTFLYGEPMRAAEPRALRPAEMLDGALINGHYDWAALRNPTYLYQRGRLLKRLTHESGQTVHFGGVIVARAYLPTLDEKRGNAESIARLAASLGARGAVVSTFQSGNSQTDTMLTIEACEKRGIRTAGIIAETDDGLTDFVPSADCLVSTGNEDDLVPPWRPERVVGGDDIPVEPASVLTYLGAITQLGDGQRRTASV